MKISIPSGPLIIPSTMTNTTHILVPKHSVLSDSEKEKLFKKFNVAARAFPKIFITDPPLEKLKVKVGDIIKIERASKTAGTTVYYRAVTEQ